jgi:purine-nucleoside phosphorylase
MNGIAPTVLLVAGLEQARRIAREILEEPTPYNYSDEMVGFTGMVTLSDGRTERVSIQSFGLRLPSMKYCAGRLFEQYGVLTLIQLGTCSGFLQRMKPGHVIIAKGAYTRNDLNRPRHYGIDHAIRADFALSEWTCVVAREQGLEAIYLGDILSTNMFLCNDRLDHEWRKWAERSVLGMNIGTRELYELAREKRRYALAILLVSNVMHTKGTMGAEQYAPYFLSMAKLALTSAFPS